MNTVLYISLFLGALNAFLALLLIGYVLRMSQHRFFGPMPESVISTAIQKDDLSFAPFLQKKPPGNRSKVSIFIDGACSNNGHPSASAGWSVYVCGSQTKKLAGRPPGAQTSMRAELFALYQALRWLECHPGVYATINSDALGVVEGFNGQCKRNKNKDIWGKIDEILPSVSSRIIEVKKISREKNEEADRMAKAAARSLIAAQT